MGCNAWNHPPNCTCGWGGEGHLGGRTSSTGNRSYACSLGGNALSAVSFVDPNAICPVCGASVFFYLSPFGGRVFFDELGPPWPKHPCTDRPSKPALAASLLEVTIRKIQEYKWQSDGWKPFLISTIEKFGSNLILGGQFGSAALNLRINDPDAIKSLLPDEKNRVESGLSASALFPKSRISQVRQLSRKKFEFSFLNLEGGSIQCIAKEWTNP